MEVRPSLHPLADHPDYEVLRELGRGGMGVVYLAKHRLSGRQEVLKLMNQALLGKAGGREGFLREIQSAARLAGKSPALISHCDFCASQS